MSAKYVMLNINGLDVPIIFPDTLGHDEVSEAIIERLGGEVASAGFVKLVEKTECYGNSFSLRIPSKEGDSALMGRILDVEPDMDKEFLQMRVELLLDRIEDLSGPSN